MSNQYVKDANFVEQYIEKIVLAVGVIVLLAALFLFVIGNPFAIKSNGVPYGSPQEAIDELERNDDRLEVGLANTNPLPADADNIPEFLANVEEMEQAEVFSGTALPQLAAAGLHGKAIKPSQAEAPIYATVTPPVPANIQHKTGTDVLDVEFNPQVVQQFFDLWGGPRNPADFTMFIAEGEFAIWEWANRLKADPAQSGTTKIPPGIWNQRFGVTGTVLLREELDPATGQWTDRRIVEALPMQERILPVDKADPAQAVDLLTSLREAQAEIARPELPWVADGLNFVQIVPPRGEGGLVGEDDGLVNEFGNDEALGPAEQQIKDLEEKIEVLEERRRIREERRQPARPGGGGRDEFDRPGDVGAPAGGGGADRPERRDPIQRQIDQLQERIEKLRPRAEREREERERRVEMKRKREEERKAREALLNQRDPRATIEGADALDGVQLEKDATVRVWAADPTMQPGKTYRYKLLVSVINPLYAVPRLSDEQLSENRERVALLPTDEEVDAAPWIGPVTVEPKFRFFFAGGNDKTATIDVFRRINGKLQKASIKNVNPGDTIGGIVTKEQEDGLPPLKLDMRVNAVLVDVERRSDYSGKSVTVMIYMDEEGNLYERSQGEDKSSPELRKLNQEIADGPEWVLRPKETDAGEGFGPGEFPGGPAF